MASRKEYEALFRLSAELGGGYSKTFQEAQAKVTALQNELNNLSKTQSDITAYQRQQQAVEATNAKLATLQKQYDNIQREIDETEGFSSTLENRLLSQREKIDKTSTALARQTERLNDLGRALTNAGVDTDDLTGSQARLTAETERLRAQQNTTANNTAKLATEMYGLDRRQEQAADSAQQFGKSGAQAAISVGDALAGAGISTILREIEEYFVRCAKASISFESAMTGVSKTTDLTDAELAEMSLDIQEMATEIPTAANEIASVTESAGQLGIAKKNLLDFASVMVDLGESTNLTSDAAASSLAKFANVVDMSADNYDRLGAVIVDLGNHFATTEADIVEMGTRLASSGAIIGLSEAEIMAVATALSSVGIEAEAGGSAISKLLKQFETMVVTGDDSLADFAEVAGLSAEEFSQAWGDNAVNALGLFIDGLGRIDEQGGSSVAVLESLGLTEIRLSNAVLALASSNGILNTALDTANTAWDENTALTAEAEKRYATTESKLAMLQNAYTNLSAAVGDTYTPALKDAAEVGTDVLNGLTDFVRANPEIVKAVTAGGTVIGGVTIALTGYTAAAKIASAASAAFAAVTGTALGPVMLVTAGIAALVSGITYFVSLANDDAVPSVKELTEETRALNEAMEEAEAEYEAVTEKSAATVAAAEHYIDKLAQLEAQQSMTDEQAREYSDTIGLLVNLVPELNDYVTESADQFGRVTYSLNSGTEALYDYMEAYEQAARQSAMEDYLDSYRTAYNSAYTEMYQNQLELARVTDELTQMEAERADIVERIDQIGSLPSTTVEQRAELDRLYNALGPLNQKMQEAYRTQDVYARAVEDAVPVLQKAESEMYAAQEAMAAYNDTAEEGTAGLNEMNAAANSLTETLELMRESYNEVYEAAYESIQGQFALWEEAEEPVATSIYGINNALSSQISYWEDYNENLQKLIGRASEIDGLSEVIASFADGSEESVAAIAGMAGASDADLAAMVENWRELQSAQEEAAAGIADLATGYAPELEALVAEFEQAVADMDLSEEAAASGKSTIQGFISSAEDLMPQVEKVYAQVAQTAIGAIDKKLDIHSPSRVMEEKAEMTWAGYLRRTEAMEPEIAAVMAEAAGVGVTAVETTGTAQAAYAVLEPAGGGGYAPVIQVTIQVNGNATQETVAELKAYGNDFAEAVRDVVLEMQTEQDRHAYV